MTNPHNIKVGDVLYYVSGNRRNTEGIRPCTVTKVGNKYFYCDNLKGILTNLIEDVSCGWRGTFYRSEEEYKKEKTIEYYKSKIIDLLMYRSEIITFEDFDGVIGILKKYM